jgi:hypothetical protein
MMLMLLKIPNELIEPETIDESKVGRQGLVDERT